MKRIILSLTAFTICCLQAVCQDKVIIHSTDDFKRDIPFFEAYLEGISSFEADIALEGKTIMIADDSGRNLESTYMEPVSRLFRDNGGRIRKGTEGRIQMVFDIKDTDGEKTLKALEKMLSKYPGAFDLMQNEYAVHVLVTGNIPSPEKFSEYAACISFEGKPGADYTEEQYKRIGMIGCDFTALSSWNGKGSMKPDEEKSVIEAIAQAHKSGKPIRFIGAPDNTTAWNRLNYLGADMICTEDVKACGEFFADAGTQEFRLTSETKGDFVAKVKFLDKTTRDFGGFWAENTKLSKPLPVYVPEYAFSDSARIKNVILMIGDGMGLAEAYSAYTVNGGLSMFNMDKVAFVQTHSKNRYTTDSSGAGSSIATGTPNSNGKIAMSDDGKPIPSITEILSEKGTACGVISLGNIADATPAAFYGHAKDRDMKYEITSCLTDGHLTFLCGSEYKTFSQRPDGTNLFDELDDQYIITDAIEDIDETGSKEICIDDRMGKPATEETVGMLAGITAKSLRKMDAASDGNGFFMMIEGAKIDYAGHAKFLPASVLETMSFDLAVAEALKFADEDGETLVIVTADHETGGMVIVDGDKDEHSITVKYMTEDHTPTPVPLFAYGPGAENFTGIYRNTEIFHRILECLGLPQR